jgi:hypothetical protein
MKVKKIKVSKYLNKETLHQVAAMWRACGYKVVFV